VQIPDIILEAVQTLFFASYAVFPFIFAHLDISINLFSVFVAISEEMTIGSGPSRLP